MNLTLCAGTCVNTGNDPKNCGVCGKKCDDKKPTCSAAVCVAVGMSG
jgi:hypothetical protein